MSRLHKFNLKRPGVFLSVLIFYIVLTCTASQAAPFQLHNKAAVAQKQDTPPKLQPPATVRPQKTVTDSPRRILNDTTTIKSTSDTFSLKLSKDTLDAVVDYEAEDSAVLLIKEQKFILYGKTQTTYKDIVVTAPQTTMDQQNNVLIALASKDSLGRIITRAVFKQGQQLVESDKFVYNFKSQKGLTTNSYTKEGDFFIKANESKKVGENIVYVKGGYFTTCNLDYPHFAFKTNKMKVISNNIAVSGPTHPEFEGIPIPIYLPFGIYPLSQGRHSGLLAPQFAANQQYGLGLEGLGYYHVLNDYVDVTLRTNIYSYGGWNVNIIPQYRKRYRYTGSFNLALSHTKLNFKGDPDYSLVKAFQIGWNHSLDGKAKPGTNFSASVNAGSTRYNERVANNPYQNVTNQMYSSIAYSKTWIGKPYSLQLSANHNQNNATRLINVILPDAGFTVTTINPFQRKKMVGDPKWYEKIGIGYSGVARNQLAFYDTGKVNIRSLLDTMQWGAQHRFPLSIQLPPLGNFIVSPSISYDETWYNKRYTRAWNNTTKKVDTITASKGFFTDRQLSFGLGFNTSIYGMYTFGKNSYVQAIRHVIRPTFSFNYKPNISKRSFDVIQTDTLGRKTAIPQFQGNLFSPYSYGRFGGISFGIDNNVEMKVRSKKDTGENAIKKVTLIDGFSVTSGYNFLDTAFQLQPLNVNFRTTLFNKISISANGLVDPYQATDSGLRINRFVWDAGRFSLGRFTGGSVSISTSFQSKPKDGSKQKAPGTSTITDPALLNDQRLLAEYMQRNPAEFVDFNVDWSVNLSYSLSLSRTLKPDYTGYTSQVSSSISFNNSFNLTPKWNFSTNGFYDFNTNKLTMFTMSIAREMHCWQMAIGVTPIGNIQYFNITISPKSSLLRDLRVNRTRTFYNY